MVNNAINNTANNSNETPTITITKKNPNGTRQEYIDNATETLKRDFPAAGFTQGIEVDQYRPITGQQVEYESAYKSFIDAGQSPEKARENASAYIKQHTGGLNAPSPVTIGGQPLGQQLPLIPLNGNPLPLDVTQYQIRL